MARINGGLPMSFLAKYPKGLTTLFLVEMWERFSYYGMRAILVLFLVDSVATGGLGMAIAEAAAIYGIYTASVYILALPGGWVADRLWGARRAILVGGVVIMIGHVLLAVAGQLASVFYLGLACIAVGTGLLKPNISSMVDVRVNAALGSSPIGGWALQPASTTTAASVVMMSFDMIC